MVLGYGVFGEGLLELLQRSYLSNVGSTVLLSACNQRLNSLLLFFFQKTFLIASDRGYSHITQKMISQLSRNWCEIGFRKVFIFKLGKSVKSAHD